MSEKSIKWNANSKDGQRLLYMFTKGMIATDAKPSQIRASVPEFQKYKADSFRQAFYRMKTQNALFTPKCGGVTLKNEKGKPLALFQKLCCSIFLHHCVLIRLIVVLFK
jgi:hypothetical protein